MQTNELAMRDEVLLISGTDSKKCMGCGKCSATCPASLNMDILPHRFVRYVSDGLISELIESETLFQCLSCFACVERCPRSVEPAALVEAVRLLVIRERDSNIFDPEHVSKAISIDEDIPQQLFVSMFRKFRK